MHCALPCTQSSNPVKTASASPLDPSQDHRQRVGGLVDRGREILRGTDVFAVRVVHDRTLTRTRPYCEMDAAIEAGNSRR